MHRSVSTWSELATVWPGDYNFMMAGECLPFSFDLPPLAQVVDELRADDEARITPGRRTEGLDMEDIAARFRATPIEEAMRQPFSLGHFNLPRFYGAGQLFEGFEQQVMDPWRSALSAAGFTWSRCYPIVFISGAGCLTGYHMDHSTVIAWQRFGTKRFVGLTEPRRFAGRETRKAFTKEGIGAVVRPESMTADDELAYVMSPGDLLWNVIHTPHWVEAGDEPSMSINISHGGLRLHGRLHPLEAELEAIREELAGSA